MRNLTDSPNVPESTLYPSGRIKDNTGSGDGTPVDEKVYGDLHQNIWALIRRWGIVPNGLPDNTQTGYQIVEALRALPSKNDFVLDVSGTAGLMTIATKVSLFELREAIICRATFNFGFQSSWPVTTLLRGNNNVNVNASVKDRFYTGDFLLIVKSSTGVDVYLLTDSLNLDRIAGEKGYLKAANNSEELAGIATKATTPASNLNAFIFRVNGDGSDSYLAAPSRNGLMSQEDKTKLDSLGSEILNKGKISGVDAGGGTVGQTFPVTGDITSATVTSASGGVTVIRVVVPNTMTNLDYYVRIFIGSTGSSIGGDSGLRCPVFKVITATTFDLAISETNNDVQSLNVFIETIKL